MNGLKEKLTWLFNPEIRFWCSIIRLTGIDTLFIDSGFVALHISIFNIILY